MQSKRASMLAQHPRAGCVRAAARRTLCLPLLHEPPPPPQKQAARLQLRRTPCAPSVTVWMPPIKSASEGFFTTFSSSLPCAVAISCTPRCAIVRAASDSASVPISSITITWEQGRGR